jgi:transposase-like protein
MIPKNKTHVDPSTSSGSSPGRDRAMPVTGLAAPPLWSRQIDLARFHSKQLSEPVDFRDSPIPDCGTRIGAATLARTIPCAVAGCTEIYTASADETVSDSSKYICKHHPHTAQLRTFETYAAVYSKNPPQFWTALPRYEVTDGGTKSYPYRFRSRNKLPDNRLTLRLDVQQSPSPTVNGLIPITMGTTLAGEELFCFIPRHNYERLKQVCIAEVSKKPTKRDHTGKKKDSVESVGVVQRNYANEPNVELSVYQIAVHSGKQVLPWPHNQKPVIGEAEWVHFPTWVKQLPKRERPTSGSYEPFFGSRQLKPNLKYLPEILILNAPSHRNLPRKELFKACAERKYLYQTMTKFLRQVAPKVFRHTDSIGGPPDPRPTCARCGGNWVEPTASSFTCLDCGQYQYVSGQGKFEELKQHVLTESLEGAGFGQMSAQTIESKLLTHAGIEVGEKNGVTVSTQRHRSDASNTIRVTQAEIAGTLLDNAAKYKRTSGFMNRLIVVCEYNLAVNKGWLLRDYADSVGVPEETARTWIKRFDKQVERYRAAGKNVELNEETEKRFISLLLNKIEK